MLGLGLGRIWSDMVGLSWTGWNDGSSHIWSAVANEERHRFGIVKTVSGIWSAVANGERHRFEIVKTASDEPKRRRRCLCRRTPCVKSPSG